MIDYEKLKEAHELCAKLDKRCSLEVCFFRLGKPRFIFCHGSSEVNDICVEEIDDLIAKLQELTKPEPKFKVGKEVWYVGADNEPCSLIINYMTPTSMRLCDKDGFSVDSDSVYPSRQALIQSQIDYWTNLFSNSYHPYIVDLSGIDKEKFLKEWEKNNRSSKVTFVGDDSNHIELDIKANESVTNCNRLECEHDIDVLSDNPNFSPYRKGYYICKKSNDAYCQCGMLADFPHQCKCKHCGEFYR